jgi:hypothetical protein
MTFYPLIRKSFPIALIIILSFLSANSFAKKLNPLKDMITTSETFRIPAGEAFLRRFVEIPDCGLARFLFKSIVVSPEVSVLSSYDSLLGSWYVRIPTLQRAKTNTDIGVPIYVYGKGYETASVELVRGQGTFDTNLITPEIIRSLGVNVEILDGFNPALDHIFNVHISGRCGDSYFTAVPPDTN